MSALEKAKNEIITRLNTALPGVDIDISDFEKPPQAGMGDLAYPCFAAAKEMKKSPAELAKEAASEFEPGLLVAEAVASGPYVNFRFDQSAFIKEAIDEVLKSDRAGLPELGSGRKLMIEYGQPNTHKEMHVGHLRNACLGLSEVLLSRAAGHTVVPVSYMGDVGAHVAKCLWAYQNFYLDKPVPENKGEFLGEIYADAVKRVDDNPELKEEVAEVQKKLESRDPEWAALWEKTRKWSLDQIDGAFEELGIRFERAYFESELEEDGKRIVAELLEKGIAKKSQGAVIVDLEKDDLGIFLLLKSDGSTLYSTKELALASKKYEEFDIEESIHVVDARQSLYFRQFFRTLELMGFKKKLVHLSYEFVTLKEGAMSSRTGNVVTYGSFRDEMMRRTSEETHKRHPEWQVSRVREAAWAIAEGAMKFGVLRQDPDKPIVFDVEDAISFDGFTGPYVQYAHARLSSILMKAGDAAGDDVREGGDEAEYAAIRQMAEFPDAVIAAAEAHKPSILAQYIFELAQVSNDFYRDAPVLTAKAAVRERRLKIVLALKKTLAHGLELLGIRAPDEM